jgi:hypothetical protein
MRITGVGAKRKHSLGYLKPTARRDGRHSRQQKPAIVCDALTFGTKNGCLIPTAGRISGCRPRYRHVGRPEIVVGQEGDPPLTASTASTVQAPDGHRSRTTAHAKQTFIAKGASEPATDKECRKSLSVEKRIGYGVYFAAQFRRGSQVRSLSPTIQSPQTARFRYDAK